MWGGAESAHPDFLSHLARRRGRSTDAHVPNYSLRDLSPKGACDGNGGVGTRDDGGTGHGSYFGWLDHGQLQLALDFLYQRPYWHGCLFPVDSGFAGHSCSSARKQEDRLVGARPPCPWGGLAPDHARQRRTGGLV